MRGATGKAHHVKAYTRRLSQTSSLLRNATPLASSHTLEEEGPTEADVERILKELKKNQVSEHDLDDMERRYHDAMEFPIDVSKFVPTILNSKSPEQALQRYESYVNRPVLIATQDKKLTFIATLYTVAKLSATRPTYVTASLLQTDGVRKMLELSQEAIYDANETELSSIIRSLAALQNMAVAGMHISFSFM